MSICKTRKLLSQLLTNRGLNVNDVFDAFNSHVSYWQTQKNHFCRGCKRDGGKETTIDLPCSLIRPYEEKLYFPCQNFDSKNGTVVHRLSICGCPGTIDWVWTTLLERGLTAEFVSRNIQYNSLDHSLNEYQTVINSCGYQITAEDCYRYLSNTGCVIGRAGDMRHKPVASLKVVKWLFLTNKGTLSFEQWSSVRESIQRQTHDLCCLFLGERPPPESAAIVELIDSLVNFTTEGN